MTPPKPLGRRKRRHHKVTTGCDTCKERRIKCDETKPVCRQCEKAHAVCLGYQPPQARIFEPSSSVKQTTRAASTPTNCSASKASPVASNLDVCDSIELGKSPDLRIIWQKGLLDLFLTQWLPANLARHQAVGQPESRVLLMSGWPAVAWKLGKDTNDSLVAHSLLCLVLCTLGSQTADLGLVHEATRHYAGVLTHFQQQILHLTQFGSSSWPADSIASLVAVGYSCAQTEYILGSWAGADRHLFGVASIFQSCGTSCLNTGDTSKIFLDHCLLWASCCVGSCVQYTLSPERMIATYDIEWGLFVHFANSGTVHRTSRTKTTLPTGSLSCYACQSTQGLVTIAHRLPTLLEEYDASLPLREHTEMLEYLQRFSDIVVAMELLCVSAGWISRSTATNRYAAVSEKMGWRHTHDTMEDALMLGYSSAFILHASTAMHDIARYSEACPYEESLPGKFTRNGIRTLCVEHAARLRGLVDELLNDRSAMVLNPCLFFLDSAWLAYETIGDISNGLTNMKPWFKKAGDCMAQRGFKPLREPWNAE